MENSESPKVSEEVALEEFERVMRARFLETDPAKMTKEERAVFEKGRAFFVGLVMDGHLTCSDADEATYTTYASKTQASFTFGEITGGTYLRSDQEDHGVHKTVAMISQVTGKPMATISKLNQRDFVNLKELLQVFLV